MTNDPFQSKITEVVSRNAFVTEALGHGFNAYLPVYDRGSTLSLHRERDGLSRVAQINSRRTIDRKYKW